MSQPILYPATVVNDVVDGGFVISFRDIPDAAARVNAFSEIIEMAHLVLTASKEAYEERGRTLPHPSAFRLGDVIVTL